MQCSQRCDPFEKQERGHRIQRMLRPESLHSSSHWFGCCPWQLQSHQEQIRTCRQNSNPSQSIKPCMGHATDPCSTLTYPIGTSCLLSAPLACNFFAVSTLLACESLTKIYATDSHLSQGQQHKFLLHVNLGCRHQPGKRVRLNNQAHIVRDSGVWPWLGNPGVLKKPSQSKAPKRCLNHRKALLPLARTTFHKIVLPVGQSTKNETVANSIFKSSNSYINIFLSVD